MTVVGVALAGALGALTRYGIEGIVATRQRSPFPLSTLVINVTGSIALGVLVGRVVGDHLPESTLVWAATGFLGAYTTFSTFTYESLRLFEVGAWRHGLLNVALSGPLSFAGAGLAYAIAL